MNYAFPLTSKYLSTYFKIVNHRLVSPNTEYYENHHIYPVSIYGKNLHIVKLSFREHYICHWLLAKHYFKTEGLKSANFRKMSYSFIRMCGTKVKNQYVSLSDIKGRLTSRAIASAKTYNRLAMTGSNNPYYGKKHTPEILAKMKANRGPVSATGLQNIKIAAVIQGKKTKGLITIYCPTTDVIKRVRPHYLNGYLNNGYILGNRPSDNKSRSNSLKGRKISWPIKSGLDHYAFDTIHMYHNIHGRVRVPILEKDHYLNLGYKIGMNKSEETMNRVKLASSLANKGKTKPYMAILNKDPEKIRKTAEKHTGMKRSEETKKRISDKAKGRKCSFNGLKTYYDPITLETRRIHPADIPDGWIKGDPRLKNKRKSKNDKP